MRHLHRVLMHVLGALFLFTGIAAGDDNPVSRFEDLPADSSEARQVLIEEDPPGFQSAFDSLLAVENLADPQRSEMLEEAAEAYLTVTGDSLLLADFHFVAAATPQMRDRWSRAVALDARGLALRNEGDYEGSAEAFRAAAAVYQEIGHLRREAVVWGSLGVSIWYTGDLEAVGVAYAQALDARRRLGDQVLVGRTLNGLGSVNLRLGKYGKALGYYQEAREVRRTLDNPVDLGVTTTYIGHVQYELGNLEAARSGYLEALELFGPDAPSRRLNEVRGGLANVHADLGEHKEALAVYRSVLATAEGEGDADMASLTRVNIASELTELGDRAGALRELNRARDAQEASEDTYSLTNTLNVIGGVYLDLGDLPKALQAYQEAKRLGEESENVQERAYVLLNLGSTYARMELHDRALATFEEASVAHRDLENMEGVRGALSGKAVVMEQLGKKEEALALYQEVLAMDVELGLPGNRAEDLANLGNALESLGRYDEARERYRAGIALARELGHPRVEWPCYLGIAESFEEEGVLDSALVYNGRAIEVMEGLRGSGFSEGTRAAFLGQRAFVYEAQIHVMAKMQAAGGPETLAQEAFHIAERGRARALQEMLAESRMDMSGGVSPALAAERDRTDRRIKTVRNQLRQEGAPADSLKALKRRLRDLEQQHAAVVQRIRLDNPRLNTLDAGETASVGDIRKKLLRHKKDVLIEYSLGDSASYLWVITRDKVAMHRLPPREQIEGTARTLRASLASPAATGDKTLLDSAVALYRMTLEPAGKTLGEARSIYVVPDGALHFIPFDVLISETPAELGEGEDRGKYFSALSYALKKANLNYGPSATTLLTLVDLERDRKTSPDQQEFLAVGDPVFWAGESASEGDLAPLPYTRDEVTAIAGHFQAESRTVLLGREAAEKQLLAPGFLSRFRILHFATHGLIDERRPERSRLALSFPQDPSEDGYLQASEIYNLELSADLVVLSACETGRGRIVRGEGVLGLPRAFFYAGAASVAVSLWSVSDRSTTQLMQGFYDELISRGRGRSEALRRAKDKLRGDPEFAHPFYWAPFVLMGSA